MQQSYNLSILFDDFVRSRLALGQTKPTSNRIHYIILNCAHTRRPNDSATEAAGRAAQAIGNVIRVSLQVGMQFSMENRASQQPFHPDGRLDT